MGFRAVFIKAVLARPGILAETPFGAAWRALGRGGLRVRRGRPVGRAIDFDRLSGFSDGWTEGGNLTSYPVILTDSPHSF